MSFSTPANLLTLTRIPLALCLLFTAPLSTSFFFLYTLAGITDMLDGPISRRTHTASRSGARLDSLADVVPYGDCRFEQLSYVGDYAYEQLTGKSAYDQTDWSAYEALLMKLEQDIVYKDGIEFPREGADLKKYLPRLCAKHPEWDGQTRWNLQLKEIRDLIHAGKDYDRRQTSNKKKRSRGGEAR